MAPDRPIHNEGAESRCCAPIDRVSKLGRDSQTAYISCSVISPSIKIASMFFQSWCQIAAGGGVQPCADDDGTVLRIIHFFSSRYFPSRPGGQWIVPNRFQVGRLRVIRWQKSRRVVSSRPSPQPLVGPWIHYRPLAIVVSPI